jgi:acetyltransferase-like isoleucine patch superfamily enzyme
MLANLSNTMNHIVRHCWYRLGRSFPTNDLRIFALRKMDYVEIGEDSYFGPNVTITPFNTEFKGNLLSIGDRVRFGPNVTLLCSSTPEKTKLTDIYGEIGQITIENDAWIGSGAVIQPGVTIGECSVVGSNAVVTDDVPSYTVVGGIPAKKIKDIEDEF